MANRRGILALSLVWVLGCGASRFTTADAEAIAALLEHQRRAWNDGNVEAFMAGYHRASTLTFASGGEIEHGWDETLARYQRRYPDRAAMGTLAFDVEEIRPLSPDTAMVLGHFTLSGTPRAGTGVFTLVVQRRPDGWRIVHDHTSA